MKKTLSIILALLMIFTMLAACSSEDAPGASSGTSGANEPRTVVYGTTDSFGNGFNPLSSVEGSSYPCKLLYDYPIELDPETCEIVSKIAQEHYWEEDGVTYFFKLKNNITYSDGTLMVAEDFLNSLSLMQKAGNSHSATFNCILIDECYVDEDGLGVHIVFSSPYGPADSLLMSLPICSKVFCDAYPDGDEEWWNNPLGSGAYTLKEYKMDSYITLQLRDDYWGDVEFEADEITIRYYSDSTTMMVDFQNGVIDVALNIDADAIEAVQNGTYNGTAVIQSAADVQVLCLNENNEYLQDKAVREAIAYGVDWEAVGDIAYGSLAIPATSHYGVNYPCYVEHEGYAYEPERSKQILADAGYEEGEISFVFLVMSDVQQSRIGEAVQGYLSDVGINVKVESFDNSTVLGMYMEGSCDMSLFRLTGLGASLDAYNSLAVYSATGPFPSHRVSDPTYNDYVTAGITTTDVNTRKEAYIKADDWLYDNYWALPICERMEAYCFNSRISGIDLPAVQGISIAHIHFA